MAPRTNSIGQPLPHTRAHSAPAPGEQPKRRKLLQTMDELDSYREYSQLFKEHQARLARKGADKEALAEAWIKRRQKMALTPDQNHRFKKLYALVEECYKMHAKDEEGVQKKGKQPMGKR